MEVNADFYGRREDDPDDQSSSVFEDVYPDQFFLVLTNFVGRGMPLVMDRYTGAQVWNQPIAGYRMNPVTPSDDLGVSPSAPGVYRVRVSTTLWWARDDVGPQHVTEPFGFEDSASFQSRTLRYELWLDAPLRFDSGGKLVGSGKVILARQGAAVLGGQWLNADLDPVNSHPDYLWVPHSVSRSTGFSNPAIDAAWVRSRFSAGGGR